MLDSAQGADCAQIGRIAALLDQIEPASERLASPDLPFRPWVDVLYHVTPQHAHGIAGEFDWLALPPELMGRLSVLRLQLAYEVIWFNHPDWKLPWYKKLLRRLAKSTSLRPPPAGEPP